MTNMTPLPISSVASSSDASTAGLTKAATGGLNGQSTDGDGQNEGSFLDFLNAFNDLSSAGNGTVEASMVSGSSLPLGSETAEPDRLSQLALPVSQYPITTGTALPPGATVEADLTSQSLALADAAVDEHALVTQLTGAGKDGLSTESDMSSRVASAALASRLVGMAQGSLSATQAAQVASTPTLPNTDEAVLASLQISPTAEVVPPGVLSQAVVIPTSPLQLTSRLQPGTKADPGIKDLSARPVVLSATQPAATAFTNGDVNLNTSSLQTAEPGISETDVFFAAQVKKMVAEQQGSMNTERQLIQNTLTAALANSVSTDPVSASSVRAGDMQSTLTMQAGTPISHQVTLPETFGKPGWNQGMGKQVVWMANQNIRSAELRLNPAHLGPIEVRIEMDDDKVNLAFTSRHAVVREAVEQAIPRLREMFEESGLNLADTDVSQQSFAEQRSQQAADNSDHQRSGFSNQADSTNVEGMVDAEQSRTANLGLVDYYI